MVEGINTGAQPINKPNNMNQKFFKNGTVNIPKYKIDLVIVLRKLKNEVVNYGLRFDFDLQQTPSKPTYMQDHFQNIILSNHYL